jgi:hypothetical protein
MKTRLIIAVLLFLAAGGVAEEADETWERILPGPLPGFEPRGEDGELLLAVVRVLEETHDGLRPVEGARVRCFDEDVGPATAAAPLVAEVLADEFGFARVPIEGLGAVHWLIDAPGKGCISELLPTEHVSGRDFILPGGRDRRIRIIDPFGQPVGGARAEISFGCPHAPVARAAVSDVDGFALFLNLPEDLSQETLRIVAPGARPNQYDFPEPKVADWMLGMEVSAATVVTVPGRDARGTVVDAEGAPIPGVVIRASGEAWGPVAVSDGSGRFVIYGVIDGQPLLFFDPRAEHDGRPGCIVREFHSDVPLVVRLHCDRETVHGEGGVCSSVRISVGTWKVPVTLSRRSDGFTVGGRTGEDFRGLDAWWLHGLFVANVPEGEYLVTVGGGFSERAEERRVLRLPVPGGGPVEFDPPRQPALGIGERDWPEDPYWPSPDVLLAIPGRSVPVDLHGYGSIYLPADTPAALMIRGSRSAVFPVKEREGRHRRVDVVAPEMTRIRVRVKSGSGKAVPFGWWLGPAGDQVGVDCSDEEAEGEALIPTFLFGRVTLILSAEDHASASVDLDLPDEPTDPVDAGEVVLEPLLTRTLTLLDGAGKPIVGAGLTKPGEGWMGEERTDLAGRIEVSVSSRQEVVEMRAEGRYPRRFSVSKDSPETVKLKGADLTVLAALPVGTRLPFSLWLDGHRIVEKERIAEIRGVPPGPHLLLLQAEGRKAVARRIVIDEESTVRKMAVLLLE